MKFQIVLVSVIVVVANAGVLQSGYGGGYGGGHGGWAGPQVSQVGYSVSHQGGGYGGYHGPQHIPVLDKRGVPVETPEVQVAKQQHFQAYQLAQAKQASIGWQPEEKYGGGWQQAQYAQSYSGGWQPAYAGHGGYSGGYGYAQPLTAEGVPEETPEVKLAKAQHFAAYAVEQSKHAQWQGQNQHGSQW